MSLPTESLDLFRGQWADRMTDACLIRSDSGGDVFDPDTGLITPGWTTEYDGPCLVRPATAGSAEFGEAEVPTFDYVVYIPHTVEGIAPGQQVVVSSVTDHELDGIELVIDNVNRDTYVTVRKLACTEAPHAS